MVSPSSPTVDARSTARARIASRVSAVSTELTQGSLAHERSCFPLRYGLSRAGDTRRGGTAMANYTVKRIDEMEAVYAGAFKRARASLGVTAFGMQVLDFPPNADRYPEHDHAEDGQEEVYVTLSGDGEIEVEGERHT